MAMTTQNLQHRVIGTVGCSTLAGKKKSPEVAAGSTASSLLDRLAGDPGRCYLSTKTGTVTQVDIQTRQGFQIAGIFQASGILGMET